MGAIETRAGFAALGPRLGALRLRSEAISETVSRATLTISAAQASLISLRDTGRQSQLSVEQKATLDDVGLPLLGAATRCAALANCVANALAANGIELKAEFDAAFAAADAPRCAEAIAVMEQQTSEMEARLENDGEPLLELVDGIGQELTALDRH